MTSTLADILAQPSTAHEHKTPTHLDGRQLPPGRDRNDSYHIHRTDRRRDLYRVTYYPWGGSPIVLAEDVDGRLECAALTYRHYWGMTEQAPTPIHEPAPTTLDDLAARLAALPPITETDQP